LTHAPPVSTTQALISGGLAFFHPPSLSWVTARQFEQGVGLLMLAMGLSLSTEDFRKCAANPVPILLGFVCQYSVLPALAFVIARALHLSPALSTGLILLGCCPGGQASNVATYVVRSCMLVPGVALSVRSAAARRITLPDPPTAPPASQARGDVALSVLMTAFSTVAAVVMTPALTSALAGQFIPVDFWALAGSTVRLVLLPTLAGVALNELLPRPVAAVRPAMPLLALALTVVLCAVPVAQVADVLR
jgi:BASS family bile acid:Na+ symporter